MTNMILHLTLESDAAFGRGDGVAGLVDAEVQHDKYGFPYIGGRTLKGLLAEECANLLYALTSMERDKQWKEKWIQAADALFGTPGSGIKDFARLRVGPAQLPAALRMAAKNEYVDKTADEMRAAMLPALTDLRRQTAVDPETGAPQQETLRTVRVVLRRTTFSASLAIAPDKNGSEADDQRLLGLLAAAVLALRRGGSERNRGRGELTARLFKDEEDVTMRYFENHFVATLDAAGFGQEVS
ncbi:MAG: RAMP superfamily protein [Caldilineaceae bacterium]|nr:RAMP superfamily protein [Caldilineaceae bacterium]